MTYSGAEIRPVLVGVGDREDEEYVVRQAAEEAVRRGTGVRLLHVVDWPPPAGAALSPQVVAQTVTAPYVLLLQAEYPRVPVWQTWGSGSPAPLLVENAEDAVLCVLGHRGHRGPARLTAGSVALHVAGQASCPVLVVKPEREAEHAGKAGGPVIEQAGRRTGVVAGVEGTDPAEQVLDFAFAEAQLRGTTLEIVHADHRPQVLPPGLAPPEQSDLAGITNAEIRVLETRIGPLRDRYRDVQVSVRIEHTGPVPALLDAGLGAAVVVVGSHGRTGIRRLIIGSVSSEILHRAACPVMVVPAAGPPAGHGADG
ncbi:universal stress protein [Kitasatospora sp. GP82]|uniref:universal stress protein n=1 Tax=Kitasatospora sp. GP82 TaxID=3035089 RepID=UPI0024741A87|nr:universal stress protein [Kitasatospora sp. GP82]MDH6126352.1 nucleotide-binding universal stress UspA family protein [Kitasatospora sp. GP82]